LGVVTNKAARFTDPFDAGHALFLSARTVVSGDTTPHAKPHRSPCSRPPGALPIDPARCLYVGDDERRYRAGLAAGMGTVAATYGYLGQKAIRPGGGACQP